MKYDLKHVKHFNLGSVILIIAMLVMVMIPLPPFVLDMLFSFNIAISLIILMVCLYVMRPLDFSVFPTILLITTLLRLTLNIASTRVVLLHGHEGTHVAGQVIRSFGEVVIGGSFVVGLIIFIILMIINFIVVTKGAGRISEVSARFTLDAMPGKQMAIDADLNAGILSQEEAKLRRKEIIMEADFYGAMDGASKFVRGDAIAGLMILVINLLGGIIIGTAQYDMSFYNAAQTFSILTIGDGLAAQIPSLLLSIAAAMMVTRVSNDSNISEQTTSQLLGDAKPILLSALVLGIIALIPNMPHTPLLTMAAGGFIFSYFLNQKNKEQSVSAGIINHPTISQNHAEQNNVDWEDVSHLDRIAIEVGYGLISLIGTKKDGQLVARIKGVRKKLSNKLGFLIPVIHIKDNFNLPPHTYRIYLKGVQVAESVIYPDKLMAISVGEATQSLPGIPAKDPSFGLTCYWITPNQKNHADNLGFTVVDPSTVIATHINQIIETNAGNIFGYEEVQQLIARLTQHEPKLAELLTSSAYGLPMTVIFTVLQKLLNTGIQIVDMTSIAETMIDVWSRSKDQEIVFAAVRIALKQLIIYNLCGTEKELPVAVLDPELTQILMKSVQVNQVFNEKMIVLEPSLTDKIYNFLLEYTKKCEIHTFPGIILIHDDIRMMMERLFKAGFPHLHFLGFAEIPENKQIKIIDKIG